MPVVLPFVPPIVLPNVLLALQVHCLIGDYHTGLQSLYPLNVFDKASMYTSLLSGCHINLYYYTSFAYLMLQRYTDAGRWAQVAASEAWFAAQADRCRAFSASSTAQSSVCQPCTFAAAPACMLVHV